MVVEFSPANSSMLCDGGWHTVRAEKDGIVGTIIVDGTNIATQSSPQGGYVAMNTFDLLYVGGVPEMERVPFALTSSFSGCLANLQLVDESGQIQTPVLSQAPFASGVTFDSCT